MTQCSVGEGRGYLTVCLLWSVMMVGWAQLMYSCGRGGGGRDGGEGEGGGGRDGGEGEGREEGGGMEVREGREEGEGCR